MPQNSMVEALVTTLGNTAVYTCNSGYELSTGTLTVTRQCMANSEWSGVTPSCISKIAWKHHISWINNSQCHIYKVLTVDLLRKRSMDKSPLQQQHSNQQPHIPVTQAMNLSLEIIRLLECVKLMDPGLTQHLSVNV